MFFCVVSHRTINSLQSVLLSRLLGTRLRGGALYSLPCLGLLFLLATRRGLRTSPFRPRLAGVDMESVCACLLSNLTSVARHHRVERKIHTLSVHISLPSLLG